MCQHKLTCQELSFAEHFIVEIHNHPTSCVEVYRASSERHVTHWSRNNDFANLAVVRSGRLIIPMSEEIKKSKPVRCMQIILVQANRSSGV